MRSELENYGRQLGLERRLIFCGWVKKVPEVYADLDILSLTSINEGTPVSIIEAMAAGVPVAATDAGGVGDLLGSPIAAARTGAPWVCERGLRCEIDDAGGLAAGWSLLLDPEGGKNVEQIQRARDFVVRHYSQERLLADVTRLYDRLMAETREGRPAQRVRRFMHPVEVAN